MVLISLWPVSGNPESVASRVMRLQCNDELQKKQHQFSIPELRKRIETMYTLAQSAHPLCDRTENASNLYINLWEYLSQSHWTALDAVAVYWDRAFSFRHAIGHRNVVRKICWRQGRKKRSISYQPCNYVFMQIYFCPSINIYYIVGGFNPFENYASNWNPFPR